MFEEIQKKDISDLITKDTTLVIDADGLAYIPSTIVQETYITVTHTKSKRTMDFKNLTEFKGRGKGKNISPDSWLGSTNTKRAVMNQSLFDLADFTIEQKQKDKLPLYIATNAIDSHIKMLLEKTGCSDYLLLLGSGENRRHKLPLPKKYKSNRDSTLRPLALDACRSHMKENYKHKYVTGMEADDILSIYGFAGYQNYLKTGKFNYIVSTNDKDGFGTPSLLLDWAKNGDKLKHENLFLIPDTSKSVGGIDLIKGELKGYGLMQIVHQCLTGDQADFYFAFKNTNTDYSLGDKGLFEKLYGKTTPKDALQVIVDCYKEAYPEFVEFTAWDGSDQKLSWLEWAEMQFTCAYMPRSMKDTMSLEKLLKHFKVDY